MAENEFWILALSGGGARGLFTAKVLEKMEEVVGSPLASRFDLIAGTSVGGVLALGLAKEIPAKELVGLFEHDKEIFAPRCRLFPWPIFKTKYKADALKILLSDEKCFGKTLIGELKHRVIIPAINYTKGTPSFFKTPHHHTFRTDWQYQLVDVALASAAAPTYFPIYGFADQHFVDGGLVANAPGLIAVHEALHFVGHPKVDSIHVVSVGTAGQGTAMDTSASNNMGILSSFMGFKSQRSCIFHKMAYAIKNWKDWGFRKGWGFRLFDLTINSQEAMSYSMLSHWLKNRHHLIDTNPQKEQIKYLGLDDVSDAARKARLGQAAIAVQNLLTPELINSIRDHVPGEAMFFYGPNKNTPD